MRFSARRLFLFVLCAGFLPAQTSVHAEEALKRFFEGKQVRVKIDMPGTHHGIDLHYKKEPPVDFKTYEDREDRTEVEFVSGVVVKFRVNSK